MATDVLTYALTHLFTYALHIQATQPSFQQALNQNAGMQGLNQTTRTLGHMQVSKRHKITQQQKIHDHMAHANSQQSYTATRPHATFQKAQGHTTHQTTRS